jgi:hypothetical protein
MRLLLPLALLALAAFSCVYEAPLPAASPPHSEHVTVDYSVKVHEEPTVAATVHPGSSADEVLILQSTHLDRPAEVVGIVDVHEEVGHHDAALAELRRRAAALGADAVVGVEFHHGESHGEPTHLSGLAVRFVSALP